MDKELYKIAVKACSDVYDNNTDLGSTEYTHFSTTYKGQRLQVLAIAGTNDLKDWLININLFSKKGIKYGAYKSAQRIKKDIKLYKGTKLLVCGHSKAGPTAIAFKRLFGAEYCVAFAPARSLRYWINRKMRNTTIFIDPDDLVSKVGFINFCHPICKVIKAKEDHLLFSVSDHVMKHWVKFVENIDENI